MPYNDSTVIFGGLMHIPVLIVVLKLVENRFKKMKLNIKNVKLKTA